MTSVIVGLVAPLVGVAAGFLIRASMARSGARTIEARATTTLTNARQESDQIRREAEQVRVQAEQEAAQTLRRSLEEAKNDAAQIRREAEEDVKARREEIARLERRIGEAEDEIRTRTQRLDARAEELQERDERLAEVRARLERAAEQHRAQLERVAGMTSAEARETLVSEVVDDAKRSAMTQVREIEQRAREEGEERARKILTVAIQRVASEQTAESTVAVFTLPSEDMKGRIIGREGRNIRAFEAATGVNIIIDDTPEAVVLSSFDPVRREAARLTLEKLVADGRIHPARIEEVHERSLAEIDERIRRAGEDAVAEVGITDIHPEMVKLLGRLQFRTSYGQNVLKHLVESAHIASSLAAELGVDPTVAKRGAFLHDVGKAVTHEVEGSHAIIGAEIARRMREDPEVVHCIESHHGEVEQRTIHAVLAQIADSISGGRPGARRESLETYVKRLERLEEICNAFEGVEKVYAMQAGREVRVLVQPQDVDDIQAQVIARDIAKQVEEELQYPGQIRITVVRETRATEYAR
jgi:ribonuclease Y